MVDDMLKSKKSIVISGDTGSGKTDLLFDVVDNLIKNKESMFILDSKSEYINNYYDLLKENNYNIVTINLKDLNKTEGWNPLEYPYKLYKEGNTNKCKEYLERLAREICWDDDANDFWVSSASDLFVGCTLALFDEGNSDEINLNSVCNMLNSDYLSMYFKSLDKDTDAYTYASASINAPYDTYGGILATARCKIRVLCTNKELSYMLNKTTYKLDLTKPTVIFFLARDEYMIHNSLVNIFINELYSILIDNNTKFNLILDNYDVIRVPHNLYDMIYASQSREIKIYIATRLMNNFDNRVKELCKVINSNSYSKNKLNLNKSNIIYPMLNKNKLNIFDIDSRVVEIKREEYNIPDTDLDITIGEMLEDLDNKFKELDDEIK